MKTVFDGIRTNADGLAKELKCKPAKKEGQFTVPGAAMSAKSVLLSAFDYGIPMLDDESGEPRPFTNIRDEVKAAKDAEAKAERNDSQIIRDNLADQLRKLADSLESEEPDVAMAESMLALSMDIEKWSKEHAAISGEVAGRS